MKKAATNQNFLLICGRTNILPLTRPHQPGAEPDHLNRSSFYKFHYLSLLIQKSKMFDSEMIRRTEF